MHSNVPFLYSLLFISVVGGVAVLVALDPYCVTHYKFVNLTLMVSIVDYLLFDHLHLSSARKCNTLEVKLFQCLQCLGVLLKANGL